MINPGRGISGKATLLRAGLVLIALSSGLMFAQGFSAAISGVVHDTTGAVVPGVSVIVKHIESGLTRIAVTSENGGYSIQALPVGPYEVTTDLAGFKQQVRREIGRAAGRERVEIVGEEGG